MKSRNPVLSNKTFQGVGTGAEPMTLGGTVNKTAMLLALVLITAGWVWGHFFQGDKALVTHAMWIGIGAGFITALITIFFRRAAPYTAPLYALFEGLAIGGISAYYEVQFPGIVLQAVGLTFGTMVCMLALYRSGLIRVTHKFRLGVVAATGGICLLYLADWIMGYFGHSIGFINGGGTIGILFSLFVVGIAALNLVLDFDQIERGIEAGAPKYMEWYGAFGLMVTLIWLYLEILRLLAKTRD